MQTSYDICRVRLVDASQNIAPTSRSRLASDMFSTSVTSRLPGGSCFRKFQDIFCGVLVAIPFLATVLTFKLPHVQRHGGVNMPTARAAFAGGKESVSNANLFTIPRGFVFQHGSKPPEAGATDVLGKRAHPDHSAHVQVFNGNNVEVPDKIGGELVQTVLAAIGNLGVNFCHHDLLPRSPLTAIYLSSQPLLRSCETLGVFGRVSRIGVASAIAQRCQPRDSKVDPDLPSGLWKRDFVRFVQTKAHEVSSGTVLDYRNRAWLARELATPLDSEATDFGNCKVAISSVPFESVDRVFSGLLPMFGAESRILGTLGEEIGESRLQMPQGLLLRNAGRFSQPCEFRVIAVLRPFLGTSHVVQRLPVLETVSAQPQRKIVCMSSAAKLPRKLPLLALCRVKSKCLS